MGQFLTQFVIKFNKLYYPVTEQVSVLNSSSRHCIAKGMEYKNYIAYKHKLHANTQVQLFVITIQTNEA